MRLRRLTRKTQPHGGCGIWIEVSPFGSRYLASNQRISRQNICFLACVTRRLQLILLWPTSFTTLIIRGSHVKSWRHAHSYHTTFLCGSRSSIFMPMSHSHTRSDIHVSLSLEATSLYLMWYLCRLQTCSLKLSHSRSHKHVNSCMEDISFKWPLETTSTLSLRCKKLQPVCFVICCTISCFYLHHLSNTISASEFQRVLLLPDLVIEIHSYPLISAPHLSIIVLVLGLIPRVSGQAALLTSPAFHPRSVHFLTAAFRGVT